MKKLLIKVVCLLLSIMFAISMVGCTTTEDTASSLTTSESLEETTSSLVESEEEESSMLDKQPSISEFDEQMEQEKKEESAPVTSEMTEAQTEETEIESEIIDEIEENELELTESTVESELSEEDISQILEEPEGPIVTDWEFLGNVYVTGYTWTGNPCANGNYPTSGYTVACNDLPFGTVVYIEGIGYRTVEDRGGMTSGIYWLDVYFDSTQECYNATGYYDAWIVK